LYTRSRAKPLLDEDVFKKIQDVFEKEGSDSWWKRSAARFPEWRIQTPKITIRCSISSMSGLNPAAHMRFVAEDRDELHSPADMYLEGSDQHRGWFHSSLLESCGTRGRCAV
jgi:isoleucyl-tRNA synthetase